MHPEQIIESVGSWLLTYLLHSSVLLGVALAIFLPIFKMIGGLAGR